ncbi:hypothetical protein SAMN05216360_10153 [Methylobacterium phyllostachyos]|uniref:Uncharacterized protein n=1 Tax=Methylobacterium phyllostachyos TaxID=582672 RepID=A0A1G9R1R6_9HYPH|nr:hypothetical protein [Methylobacterium phyllostachyos]SDM17189.1 hypothetical protein SAMN05216360_10153 [Methylobacterium phyllostachyos]
MSLSEPVEFVRRLGSTPRIGAIVLAEQAIDTYLTGYTRMEDRGIALDILLRDLARLRFQAPEFDAFISEVEGYIDLLHRHLSRQAA